MEVVLSTVVGALSVLLLFAAVGLGPAEALLGRLAPVTRWALAPVLGLALGSVVLTTASFLIPMNTAAWALLLPGAVASAGAGVLLARRRRTGRVRARPAALLAACLVVGVGTAAVPLVAHDSTGPVGYLVNDATGGYPGIEIGLREHALNEGGDWGPRWDMTTAYGQSWARGFQQGGFDTLAAATAALFGWSSTDRQSMFMIALILVGQCGLFACVGLLPRRPDDRFAAFAALLYAGPVAYQLFIDGSQSALAAMALAAPLALAAGWLVSGGGTRAFLATALLASALQTIYPLVVPATVVGGGALVLGLAWSRRRAGRTWRAALTPLAALAGALAVAFLASPVAFERNLRYWDTVATDDFLGVLTGFFPQYGVTVPTGLGYVSQATAFPYFRTGIADGAFDVVFGVTVLVLLAGVAVVLARSGVAGVAVLCLLSGQVLLALVARFREDCTYCMQRNLSTAGPLIAVGVALALLALWRGRRVPRAVAGAGVATALVVSLLGVSHLARRAIDGGYALPRDAVRVLQAVEGRQGTVLLEGGNASNHAVHELPALYHRLYESGPQRIAVDRRFDDHSGFWAFGGVPFSTQQFASDYRWVVTRFAGLRTGRRVVERHGPYSLQERTASADAFVVSGVAVERADRDPAGRAFLEGRLVVRVVASRPARLSLRVTVRSRWEVLPLSSRVLRAAGPAGRQAFCVPLGEVVTRSGDVVVDLAHPSFGPRAAPTKLEFVPRPPRGVVVEEIRVQEGDCGRV